MSTPRSHDIQVSIPSLPVGTVHYDEEPVLNAVDDAMFLGLPETPDVERFDVSSVESFAETALGHSSFAGSVHDDDRIIDASLHLRNVLGSEDFLKKASVDDLEMKLALLRQQNRSHILSKPVISPPDKKFFQEDFVVVPDHLPTFPNLDAMATDVGSLSMALDSVARHRVSNVLSRIKALKDNQLRVHAKTQQDVVMGEGGVIGIVMPTCEKDIRQSLKEVQDVLSEVEALKAIAAEQEAKKEAKSRPPRFRQLGRYRTMQRENSFNIRPGAASRESASVASPRTSTNGGSSPDSPRTPATLLREAMARQRSMDGTGWQKVGAALVEEPEEAVAGTKEMKGNMKAVAGLLMLGDRGGHDSNRVNLAMSLSGKRSAARTRQQALAHTVMDACYVGDVKTALAVLKQGVDCSTIRDRRGNSILHLAAASGKESIVAIILKRAQYPGFDAELGLVKASNQAGQVPLHLAVESANPDSVAVLLSRHSPADAQDREGKAPLHYAVAKSLTPVKSDADFAPVEMQVLRLLLQHGANLNLPEAQGNTALHTAAKFGHVWSARVLMEEGCDTSIQNEKKLTSLVCAIEHGHEDVALLLLREGKVDASIRGPQGKVALHHAAAMGLYVVVDELLRVLSSGAPNVRDAHGWTPLHYACFHGSNVGSSGGGGRLGASVRSRGGLKHSPPQAARQVRKKVAGSESKRRRRSSDYVSIVKLLISRGGEVNCVDEYGASPAELVRNVHLLRELQLAK